MIFFQQCGGKQVEELNYKYEQSNNTHMPVNIEELRNGIALLTKKQKEALARVMSNLIMADNVIDEEEIEKFTNLFGEEDREIFIKAQQMTFEEAIKRLSSSGNGDRRCAIEMLKLVANSDGVCDPTEAYLILAIKFVLEQNNYSVSSYKMTDYYISNRFVIYVEPTDLEEANVGNVITTRKNVEDNLNIISHLFASIGIQFLYIPQVVNLYKGGENDGNERRNKFVKMASYLFPTISDNDAMDAYNIITNLKIRTFVKDYLKSKLHFTTSEKHPEFLVMLGRSEVVTCGLNGKYKIDKYIDVLHMEIQDCDAKGLVERFVNEFNETVSYNHYFTFNPSNRRISYQGISKLFFNLVLRPLQTINDWTLDVYTGHHDQIILINGIDLELDYGHAARYLAIAYTSFYGDKKGFPCSPEHLSSEERQNMESIYTVCYRELKGNPTANVTSVFNRLINRKNKINNQITAQRGLTNIQGCVKIATGDNRYMITIRGKIRINGREFEETDLYQKLSKIGSED